MAKYFGKSLVAAIPFSPAMYLKTKHLYAAS
jgi:hypothetical protein